MVQSTRWIEFSAGVDDTAVIKFWHIIICYDAIVGGYYPKHFLMARDKYDEYIFALIK